MKANIREHVAGSRVRDVLPPPYREQIPKDIQPAGLYTIILCAHNRRDVVSSPTLVRAFKKIGDVAKDGIIVVGAVFTEEAKQVAAEYGARLIALHKIVWTDESARQRQL